MATYGFETVDVFTTTRFGGNPLAVFPDARGLADARMLALAAEFNLSETTFVLPPDDPANTARVRIFTRTREIPFAGHPNVGTAWVLARHGRDVGGVMRFEEMGGLVEVRVNRDAAGAVTGATVDAPQALSLGAELPPAAVAGCVGLAADDIITAAHRPVMASVGNPFLLAEVSPDALGRAVPDLGAVRATLAAEPSLAGRLPLYLYSHDGDRLRTRMFAPAGGTWEDPATGSAATPLVALLLSLQGGDTLAREVVQGVEMGRPSLLRVRAWRGEGGVRASVGGDCVGVLRGEAEV